MNLPYPTAFRDFGVRRGLYVYLMRALRSLGMQLFLVQLGDDRADIEPPVLAAGYTTRPVEPLELLPWADRPGYGLSRSFLQQASERGHRAVANFHHGDLVGYGFVARERAPVTGQVDVLVSDRLVYRYKAWTHPDHRRQHLSFARGRINKTLFPLQPGQRTVSYVETHNYASRLHRPELRPEDVGYCGIVRFGGREFPFTLPGPRRAGFRLVRSR
jgi:hypothetical protein